ncbi:MAG: aminotransferase class I/II-fold pyridoxal phosphate-dependent enzyme [Pseudomonadota bacterium]
MAVMPNVHQAEPIPDTAMDEVSRLLSSGDLFRYTSENAPVSLLEEEFAAALGSRYALAVASCSAALFLSLKALDLPKGAKVLIPAFTFAAVPSSILHAECEPLLCECGENYRIDLEDFAAKLSQAQAAIISHMRGHTSDMDAILALCAEHDIPVIEDAAHSLGTTWRGRNIGTLGRIGCFSFQSYKLLNAGEGGVLITDDSDLVARAVIMSGAYEHNWKKHPVVGDAFARWQNQLPLYNTRLGNLSAAIIRPQLKELDRRVRDGRRNHDHVAAMLNRSQWISVPESLTHEERAPDSIQFNLVGLSDSDIGSFLAAAADRGVGVQVFGRSTDNARAFWNWQFLGEVPELPQTRAMLMSACDVRLPARLSLAECELIAGAILDAAETVKRPTAAE